MTRRGIIVLFVIIILFVAGGLWFFLSTRSSIVPKEEAVARARQIVERAGGTARICEEAGRLFHRFDGGKLKIFRGQDLNDFPSIKALGKVDGVWPTGIWPTTNTGFIKMRVGTHFRGFEIHIFSAALDPSTAAYLHAIQVDGCIYVIN